jgi:hypothetical protein
MGCVQSENLQKYEEPKNCAMKKTLTITVHYAKYVKMDSGMYKLEKTQREREIPVLSCIEDSNIILRRRCRKNTATTTCSEILDNDVTQEIRW